MEKIGQDRSVMNVRRGRHYGMNDLGFATERGTFHGIECSDVFISLLNNWFSRSLMAENVSNFVETGLSGFVFQMAAKADCRRWHFRFDWFRRRLVSTQPIFPVLLGLD